MLSLLNVELYTCITLAQFATINPTAHSQSNRKRNLEPNFQYKKGVLFRAAHAWSGWADK